MFQWERSLRTTWWRVLLSAFAMAMDGGLAVQIGSETSSITLVDVLADLAIAAAATVAWWAIWGRHRKSQRARQPR